MIRKNLEIYIKGNLTSIFFIFVIAFISLFFKFNYVQALDYRDVPIFAGLIIFSLLAARYLWHMLKQTLGELPALAQKRTLGGRLAVISALKIFIALCILTACFWPIYPADLLQQLPGYFFVFCILAVITTNSAGYFPLLLLDALTYALFALVMVGIAHESSEALIAAFLTVFFTINTLIIGRQMNLTLTELNKNAQALEQAVRSANVASKFKTDFLAMISHEIRTPMNGIIGMLEIMKSSRLTAEQKDSLEVISSCSTTLLNTLNDVLDLTRVEAGLLKISNEDFDLHKLVRNTASIIESMAKAKGLSFHLDIAADVPHFINTDPNRIQQIMLNLLNNAVKFTEKGNVALNIRHISSSPSLIRVEVADTGIGISAQDRERLFKKFSQIDSDPRQQIKGSGLGLMISRQLAFLLNGRIDLTSEKGRGSTFWFDFPYNVADGVRTENVAAIESDHMAAGNNAPEGRKILVAEDNKINQMIAEKFLTGMGHDVTIVSNGSEAVAAVKDSRYDLIFMDLQMPVMDGIEACRQIKALGAGYEDIPIVAMTAFTNSRHEQTCRENGMAGYITKPYRRADIEKAIAASALSFAAPTAGAGSPAGREDYLATMADEFGPEYTAAFIERSAAMIDELYARIVKAAHARDLEQIMAAAHDLKAVARTLGMKETGAIADRIERDYKTLSPYTIKSLLLALKKHIDTEMAQLKNQPLN